MPTRSGSLWTLHQPDSAGPRLDRDRPLPVSDPSLDVIAGAVGHRQREVALDLAAGSLDLHAGAERRRRRDGDVARSGLHAQRVNLAPKVSADRAAPRLQA